MKRIAFVFLAACGASQAPGGTGGGGNVSFGGAQDSGQFRQTLDDGGIPQPDTLDANGFFNEHFNATPPADCGQSICLVPGLIRGFDWVTGTKQDELVISLASPLDPSAFTRKPLDLVVVIDHSGSMASDGRLTKVKAGLDTLIDTLQPTDRLALIAFDDTVTTAAPLSTSGPLDRAALHAAVAGLRPGGGTDIFSGLASGFAAFDALSSDHQRRVIFLSDGLATSGDTSQLDIIAMADRHVDQGIGLTTVGVGDEFDVDLMRGLAEHGAGNYYFLEDATAADEVFGQELDYFTTPIATDLALSASAGANFTLGTATGAPLYANNMMDVPAVFLASRTDQQGEPGRRGGGSVVFVDTTNSTPGGATPGEVAHFEMTYTDVLDGPTQGTQLAQTLDLDYGDPSIATSQPQPYLSQPELAERYAMFNMYAGIARATKEDPSCAKATLVALRTTGTAWVQAHPDPDLEADLALVDEYLANLDASGEIADGALPDAKTCQPYLEGGVSNDNNELQEPMACSAGGSPAGLAMILAPLALVAGRRRRRA